jgi:ankyrin repeat protein
MADYSKVDDKGNNILHNTVDTDLIRSLSEQYHYLVNLKNEKGWTPLHTAIFHKQYDVVVELLKFKNVNVNAKISRNLVDKIKHFQIFDQYHEGRTPLIMACYMRHYEIAKLLLDHPSTDINLQDAFGNSAIYYASIKYPNEKICDELLKRPELDVNHCYENQNILIGLSGDVSGGYHDEVPKVLNHESFDFNFVDKEGKPGLFFLYEFGYTRGHLLHDLMLLMIKNPKTNINVVIKKGEMSFLSCLCYNSSKFITNVLDERQDVDINIRSKSGSTALYYALMFKDFEVAKRLMSNEKLDINYEFYFLMEQYEKPENKTSVKQTIDKNKDEIMGMFLTRQDLNIDRTRSWPRTLIVTHGYIPIGIEWKYRYRSGNSVGFTYRQYEHYE